MPGLLGAPALLELACLLNDPGLPWSDWLFLNPGLLDWPGLFGKVCLTEIFCLLLCLVGSFLLIGAPTSSGVFTLLLKFFNLGLLVFWSGWFGNCLLFPELKMFLDAALDERLLFIFLGFAINWIGGFAELLIAGVVLFRKFVLSLLGFCKGLIFWLVRFPRDCEELIILGLLGFLGWFTIIFWLSGLLSGFINNGFLFELSFRDLSFTEELISDSSSLFSL